MELALHPPRAPTLLPIDSGQYIAMPALSVPAAVPSGPTYPFYDLPVEYPPPSPTNLESPVPMNIDPPSDCGTVPPAPRARWGVALQPLLNDPLCGAYWPTAAPQLAVQAPGLAQPLEPVSPDSEPERPWPAQHLEDAVEPTTPLTDEDILQGFEGWLNKSNHFSHVITMKGSIQHVSASVRNVLGYDPSDLTKRAFAKICHPADYQTVLRELRESRQAYDAHPQRGSEISLLYRARRKDGSFVWIESTGSIMHEESRTRKVAILVGRPVQRPTLDRAEIERHGGLGDAEVWLKLSRDGLLLHVSTASPGSREIFAFEPEEIVGSSMRQLAPLGDNVIISAAIESAFQGTSVRLGHRMYDRSMNEVDVVTVFYAPGGRDQKTIFCQVNTAESDRRRGSASRAYSFSSQSSCGSRTTAVTSPASLLQLALPEMSLKPDPDTHTMATRAPSADVFGELGGEDAPNFNLASHRLMLSNRQLKKDLEIAEAVWSEAGSHRVQRTPLASALHSQLGSNGPNALALSLGEPGKRRASAAKVRAAGARMDQNEIPEGFPRSSTWGLPSPGATPLICLAPSATWG